MVRGLSLSTFVPWFHGRTSNVEISVAEYSTICTQSNHTVLCIVNRLLMLYYRIQSSCCLQNRIQIAKYERSLFGGNPLVIFNPVTSMTRQLYWLSYGVFTAAEMAIQRSLIKDDIVVRIAELSRHLLASV
jgi:hypothetical protein